MPTLRIGTGIDRKSSASWSSYWTPQSISSKVLFWGKVSEISGGQMPNKITGSSDFLTVAGSPYTFQCPDNATYLGADTDLLWFDNDDVLETVTSAYLVAYDFTRTVVKYSNTSPYTISEIVILAEGAVLTTDELNHLHTYMSLWAWWSGSYNEYGFIKQNRAEEVIPTFTASVEDANKDQVIVTFSEDMDQTSVPKTTAFALAGKTISSVAYSDATTLIITVSVAYENGNAITLDYTKPDGNFLQSLLGGKIATFEDLSVTNNIAVSYDSDAQALFDRMVAVGETPSGAQKTVINDAFVAGKTKAFWAKLDCLWVFAAHGDDSALLDWMNRHNCSKVGTPDFEVNRGYTGSTNNALRTNYKPNTHKVNLSLNSATIGIYSRTNLATNTTCEISGESSAGTGVLMINKASDNNGYRSLNSGLTSFTPSRRDGLLVVSRTASNSIKLYRNTTSEHGATTASGSISDVEVYIACRNINGTISSYFTGQISLGFIAAGFDQTDVNEFYEVFVTGYLTSLGANV